MNSIFYPLAAIFLVSLISFVGVLFVGLKTDKLQRTIFILISFATGALLGDAIIHLIPEAVSQIGLTTPLSLSILAGILVFFILEKFVSWRHCHVATSTRHPHPVGTMSLVGDGLHNFLDGALIMASFVAGVSLGLATTLAVIVHEIPQEIGDFAVLLHAGYSRRRALALNFISALTAFAGGFLVLLLGNRYLGLSQMLIPFTAGGFLYVAGSDLIPELHKETAVKESFIQFMALIFGIGLMLLLK